MDNSAQIWLIIGICGFALAAIFLVISLVLFIKSHIPTIIGNLTGKTAARQIEQIRNSNEKSSPKRYKPDTFNKVNKTAQQPERPLFMANQAVAHKSKQLDMSAKDTDVLGKETEVLKDENATDVLTSATSVLNENANATEVLTNSLATEVLTDNIPQTNATTVLSDTPQKVIAATTVLNEVKISKNSTFKTVKEIKCIHTDEVIQ